MKEPAKNGNSAPGVQEPKKGEQGLVKHEPKAETLEVKVKENGPLSVEETIRRVNTLQENIDKREVLQQHLKKVSALKFGDFDEKDQLVLVDSKGNQYPIRSTNLCQECADLAKHRITQHIEEVEAQIVL